MKKKINWWKVVEFVISLAPTIKELFKKKKSNEKNTFSSKPVNTDNSVQSK